MSGMFFADGFLVSSYANTDSFAMAQAALLPLKLWCSVNKKMKGKTTCELGRNMEKPGHDALIKEDEGIHPFAKFLISFRKSFTSLVPNYKM